MLRTIWGDDERYKRQYWSDIEGSYFSGDGSRRDTDGYFWIMGRVDDVINVAGHRLGTMEVESALVSHPKVAESAVVGRPDELKGQAIVAFVTLEGGNYPSDSLREELRNHVAKEIGAIAKPDEIRFTDTLPKTRSGKIMRRLLREIAGGQKRARRRHDPRRLLRPREAALRRGVGEGYSRQQSESAVVYWLCRQPSPVSCFTSVGSTPFSAGGPVSARSRSPAAARASRLS